MTNSPELSIVVPMFDEVDSLPVLVREIRGALDEQCDWELILVDDGSTDGTARVARDLAAEVERVEVVRLARNYGQTQALAAGLDRISGQIVVTMDADLQNDPRDIPVLVRKLEEGYDMVAGYRRERRDSWLTRRLPSRLANAVIRRLTGVTIRDMGCSLRAYRRSLVDELTLYSEMHRYIPVLAAAVPGARIVDVPVRHRPRRFGESKYGLGRTFRVLADLVTLTMIRRFRDRPLRLFTLGALASAVGGVGFSLATVYATLAMGDYQAAAFVFPGSALLCFGLGAYLLMLGLLGEVAIEGAPAGRRYLERSRGGRGEG